MAKARGVLSRKRSEGEAEKKRTPNVPLTFRAAREADLDRLAAIHSSAYPVSDGLATRRRWLTHSRFGGLEDLVVAIDRRSRVLVAHAFLHPMRAWFGGRLVEVGGIASVAVAPEARGRGVGSALMHHLHATAHARGDALTMLYAFRQGYYGRLGYSSSSSHKRITFDPRSIPESWRDLGLARVRAAKRTDRASIAEVHEHVSSRLAGGLSRSRRFWDISLSRERSIIFVCERALQRGISGYVVFELTQSEDHAETTLEVTDLVAEDPTTRRALVGSLSTLRDQVADVVLDLREDDAMELALVDPDRRRFGTETVEHCLGALVAGPMVRVTEVRRALTARGYATESGRARMTFDLVVSDRELETVGVTILRGRATVGVPRQGPTIRTTSGALGAILFGGLSVRSAAGLGLIEIERKLDVSRLDALIRLPPLSPFDAF